MKLVSITLGFLYLFFCLSPILIAGVPKLGASIIPLEEFPISPFEHLKAER